MRKPLRAMTKAEAIKWAECNFLGELPQDSGASTLPEAMSGPRGLRVIVEVWGVKLEVYPAHSLPQALSRRDELEAEHQGRKYTKVYIQRGEVV